MNRKEPYGTRSGGIPLLDIPVPAKAHRHRPRAGRTIPALLRLARSHRRPARVPTLIQVCALAHFDGREPCSYLLDPAVNNVPELPLGGKDPLGKQTLRFTGECADSGRRLELVALPDAVRSTCSA